VANAQVCKTCIRGFDPRPVLQIQSENEKPLLATGAALRDASKLKSDLRPHCARFGVIEEKPHPQRLGALNSHQVQLAANVVGALQQPNLPFVEIGVSLQPGDAVFNRTAKSRTDFKTVMGSAFGQHGKLPRSFLSLKIFSGQASSSVALCRY
jgi:hypothetical protein